MGIMLSVLVFCVGVAEVLDCWHHFRFYLVQPSLPPALPQRLIPPTEPRRLSHVDISWPKDLSPSDDLHVIKKRHHGDLTTERKHDLTTTPCDNLALGPRIEVHWVEPGDECSTSPAGSRENSPSHVELSVIVESDSSTELDEPSQIENTAYKTKASEIKESSDQDADVTQINEVDPVVLDRVPIEQNPPTISIEADIAPSQLSTSLDASVDDLKLCSEPGRSGSFVQSKEGERVEINESTKKSVADVVASSKDKEVANQSLQEPDVGVESVFPTITLHESSPPPVEDHTESSSLNTSDASWMARSRASDRPLKIRIASRPDEIAEDFKSVTKTDLQAFGVKVTEEEKYKDSACCSFQQQPIGDADSKEVVVEEQTGHFVDSLDDNRNNNGTGCEVEDIKISAQIETTSSSSSLSGIPQLPEDFKESSTNIPLPSDNGYGGNTSENEKLFSDTSSSFSDRMIFSAGNSKEIEKAITNSDSISNKEKARLKEECHETRGVLVDSENNTLSKDQVENSEGREKATTNLDSTQNKEEKYNERHLEPCNVLAGSGDDIEKEPLKEDQNISTCEVSKNYASRVASMELEKNTVESKNKDKDNLKCTPISLQKAPTPENSSVDSLGVNKVSALECDATHAERSTASGTEESASKDSLSNTKAENEPTSKSEAGPPRKAPSEEEEEEFKIQRPLQRRDTKRKSKIKQRNLPKRPATPSDQTVGLCQAKESDDEDCNVCVKSDEAVSEASGAACKVAHEETEADRLIFSGEYTKAMNKDWHSGHFCCWQCDESLTGQRYVLRDEHPYCIKCYESVFANGCEECSKTIGIDSKDLSYKDKHWHEACFLCNKCRVSLVDKQFGSKLDKIFCGPCYDAQFASRCDGCGQIFKAGTKKMEYKTRQWHEPCFACCVCKTPIGTKSFIPREQEIYCATCYEEKFATRCVKCNKIITSGGVTYKNEPWHRECFTCTNCSTSLAGQRFTSRDEKPYCADCFGELFAKRCTACCKPITGIGGTRFISFEDRHWHNDCFICASCKTSLVGRGFITDAEDIICPECAKQKLM